MFKIQCPFKNIGTHLHVKMMLTVKGHMDQRPLNFYSYSYFMYLVKIIITVLEIEITN